MNNEEKRQLAFISKLLLKSLTQPKENVTNDELCILNDITESLSRGDHSDCYLK